MYRVQKYRDLAQPGRGSESMAKEEAATSWDSNYGLMASQEKSQPTTIVVLTEPLYFTAVNIKTQHFLYSSMKYRR